MSLLGQNDYAHRSTHDYFRLLQEYSLLGIFNCLGCLFSLALVSLIDSGLSESLEDVGTLHLFGECFDLASLVDDWESKDTGGGVLGGALELVSGGVVDLTLLNLALSSWEQDQLVLVLSESFNVGGHGLSVLVVSSMINDNSDRSSKGWGQLSLCELREGESSSELDLVSVLDSLSKDDWSELGDW